MISTRGPHRRYAGCCAGDDCRAVYRIVSQESVRGGVNPTAHARRRCRLKSMRSD
ncbi:hypothetical protein BSIN_0429 [Burkholderia singularis]|uniref:Uncharacterized protein n=1 Tax=Burkholderia singularis TaxID=1503053 RepID=A0A238H610_9BURK|nr:hypothetical protein BSIN_0429 [Burkholderia singularis]